jgi:hypothetical protein
VAEPHRFSVAPASGKILKAVLANNLICSTPLIFRNELNLNISSDSDDMN